jgi:t-SNARE complex subunit (syntaxin)
MIVEDEKLLMLLVVVLIMVFILTVVTFVNIAVIITVRERIFLAL